MSSGPFEPELDPTSGLKLVDAASDFEFAGEESAPDQGDGASDSRRLPLWLFVVAMILFAALIGWQAQVASGLKAEVVALEDQLERTNTLLDAHQTHLSEIRSGVHEVSQSLLGLRALVDTDPAESITSGVPEIAPVAP